jgi:hypothetical protein
MSTGPIVKGFNVDQHVQEPPVKLYFSFSGLTLPPTLRSALSLLRMVE